MNQFLGDLDRRSRRVYLPTEMRLCLREAEVFEFCCECASGSFTLVQLHDPETEAEFRDESTCEVQVPEP